MNELSGPSSVCACVCPSASACEGVCEGVRACECARVLERDRALRAVTSAIGSRHLAAPARFAGRGGRRSENLKSYALP